MNSRERVLTAFAHEEPDRVPRWCGASDEFWAKAKVELGLDNEGLRVRFGDGFRRVYSKYRVPDQQLGGGSVRRTVFGKEKWDRHLACLSQLTDWKPIPRFCE